MIKGFLKPFSVSIIFILIAFAATAQSTITGRVTDASGAGVPGVTVSVKGTRNATQTASDGSYSISVPNNSSSLVFTSVGFARQEFSVNGRRSFDITLASTSAQLNEVVVIGYGTARKKDLTGAVTTVGAKDFQKGLISTPEQLIAGKVAGVSVISNSGQPGAGSTIRIRGGSSLSASNDPLIVIDGVPLSNSSISGASNPLSLINSNDIESFTILKDASAAAIYGTRASNGVIIITTKKGRNGPLRVNFSTVNSISAIRNTVEVLSSDQFRAIVNANGSAAQKAALGTANTNWQNEIYQKAFATDNNISFTGGVKGLPYRVSLGYLNQDGILKTDNLQKFSGAVVLNPVLLNNHLKIDINLKGSIEKFRFANQGAIGSAIYFDPTQPIYSNSKRFGGYYTQTAANGDPIANPVELLNDRHDNSNVHRSIGNIQFDYKFHFLPDLHANLNLGYDVSKGTGTIFVSDSSALEYRTHGENSHYKQTTLNTLLEFYLNYVKDIPSIKSRLDILAGYGYNNYQSKFYNLPVFNVAGVQIGATPNDPYNKPEHTLLSYFGRLNYTFHDKYLLTATIRRDASSRFGPSHRWGLFPSAALAWKIKDESFLKNSKTISDLKLRLGYGITGQQEGIGNYNYLATYSLSGSSASYGFGNNYYQAYRPSGYNSDIKWEQTATTNLALDYGFFNNRISGSIDFYLRKTEDLLNSIPVPGGTNFSAYILANVGNMENKGVEFSVNVEPVRSKKTTLNIGFNATYNKNTITNLTYVPKDPNYPGFPTGGINGTQGFAYINAVGFPKNTFNLYHQIYDKAGNPIEGLFEDVNRDGILNEKDKYKGKAADPNMFYGFTTNLTYNKWNAGFVLRAAFNNYIYNNIFSNNGRLNQITGGPVLGNVSTNYLVTQFKGTSEQQLLSDYYIQNASFLKMDNLNIGYTVGKILRNKASLRANFSVQNVFTITKYQGLDPEISYGIDNNFYPRPRIYALGLNFDF